MLNPGEELRVATLIDESPLSPLQYCTFLLCGAAALFDGYDIGTVSSMAPLIAGHFGVGIRHLGPLFSSGFLGMMIGALVIGPAADCLGRKWTVTAATFIFGLFTLLVAFSPNFNVLIPLRLIAGIGLGGVLPNIIALTSEYAPRRSRGLIVTLMACGIPLGGLLAPLIGSYIGPNWGWQASFILGGILPLALCILLAAYLPESLRFMVLKQYPTEKLQTRLGEINRAYAVTGAAVSYHLSLDDEEMQRPQVSIMELFRHGRLRTTLLLWTSFFCTLLMALFIVSWLPSVLRISGLPISKSLLLASFLSAGGLLGSPVLGWLTDYVGPYRVLLPSYLIAAIGALLIGDLHQLGALGAAIFTTGFCMFGCQACIQVLATMLYPTAIRVAGVGWAFGIGRLGSIIGPLLGGAMFAAHWPLNLMFFAAALAPIASALCIALMWVLHPRTV